MNKKVQRNLAAAIILTSIAIVIYFLSQPHQVSQHSDFHYDYILISSAVAFLVGGFAYIEYRRTNHLKVYMMAIGFIGGTVLYLFHGLITPGKSIVSFPSMK